MQYFFYSQIDRFGILGDSEEILKDFITFSSLFPFFRFQFILEVVQVNRTLCMALSQ